MGVRKTLYFRKPENLEWAVRYTGARSVSEAVEQVLEEFRRIVQERRRNALARAHGVWAEDEAVEQTLRELQKGWGPGHPEEL